MQRVTDMADPQRCQSAAPDGQCRNRSEEGTHHCLVHGGRGQGENESKRRYLLANASYRARMAQLADDDGIKSLRDEIALTRMMIETRINACQTDIELLAATSTINTQLLTLEKLVRSCNQIEENLGQLLSKTTVIKLGQLLCEIVIDELEGVDGYEQIVDRINDRVMRTISQTKNAESDTKMLPAPS